MAILHKAQITPSKLELLRAWLPAQPWYDGPAEPELTRVAAARFDDPDGEVGIETMLVRAGEGPALHVPLTYRAAPLEGGEAFLVGTTQHSVLGERWVYDATGDPVYLAETARVIREGDHQAIEEVEGVPREPDLKLAGSGVDETGPVEVQVNRIPTIAVDPADEGVLTGCWTGQETPVVLVHLLRAGAS
ncbi:hypothetical protein AB0M02_41355 [Actinoplanes sp. NPDC051861]|uniref:CG0192-related protein n=1 Tax=Actinoplanes sp. NPDC051861 TaxID=3155170 RepID=UPI00344471AE